MNVLLLLFKKAAEEMFIYWGTFGFFFWGGVMVPSPKILINFSRTCERLPCKVKIYVRVGRFWIFLSETKAGICK